MKTHVLQIIPIIALLFCLGCTTPSANFAAGPDDLFRGELQVTIADDFKNQAAKIHYYLLWDKENTRLRLKFLHEPPKPALPSGTRVEIRGLRRNGLLQVETLRPSTNVKPRQ